MLITGHPQAEARRRADRIRERTGAELTAEQILDSPHVFIGSVKDLTRKFTDLRSRFGISSFLIDDLDALTPARLGEYAGRYTSVTGSESPEQRRAVVWDFVPRSAGAPAPRRGKRAPREA